jgi:hypothetical protein
MATPCQRMADYTNIVDGLRGFGVEVWSVSAFRPVRGFSTEAAAQAWIDLQRRAEALADEDASYPFTVLP